MRYIGKNDRINLISCKHCIIISHPNLYDIHKLIDRKAIIKKLTGEIL